MPHRPRVCVGVFGALMAACAPTIGVRSPGPFPGAVVAPVPGPLTVSATAPLDFRRLVQTALALQGTRYQLGGDSPASGFDCSGFVRFVFREQSWELPRTVQEQFEYGRRIGARDIQTGDLLFFATEGRGATHVGIAVDPADAPGRQSGRPFIHAPGENGAVRIDLVENAYWRSRFLGARRLF